MGAAWQRGRREKHRREPPRYPIPDAHPWVTGSGDNKATALDFGRALGGKKAPGDAVEAAPAGKAMGREGKKKSDKGRSGVNSLKI